MALRERISRFQTPANAKVANPAKAGRNEATKLAALAGLALATPGKDGSPRGTSLPSICRTDCPHLRRVELDDLPPVTACYQRQSPTNWSWTRLDQLDACPLTTKSAPTPPSTPPSTPPPTTGPEVSGLPCGGCGSTSYRLAPSGFRYPDGTLGDGWHCGTPGCHVKLLTGNKAVDHLPLLHQTESET